MKNPIEAKSWIGSRPRKFTSLLGQLELVINLKSPTAQEINSIGWNNYFCEPQVLKLTNQAQLREATLFEINGLQKLVTSSSSWIY